MNIAACWKAENYHPIQALAELDDKATVQVAGALTSVDKKFTKKDGKPFAIATIEDFTGAAEVMIWSDTFSKCVAQLEPGRVVSITARLDKREETARLVASEIAPLKPAAPAVDDGPLIVTFTRDVTTESDLLSLKSTIEQFPGPRPLELRFVNGSGLKLRMQLGSQFGVDPSPELRSRLSPWLKQSR